MNEIATYLLALFFEHHCKSIVLTRISEILGKSMLNSGKTSGILCENSV